MIKHNSIFIKNIYYMLSYAFEAMKQSNEKELAGEEFDNLHNLLSRILSKGISYQLKQGLHREYINKAENLTVMRGKIDMNGSIKNKMARNRSLFCEYDELSENNLFNQILKSTVILLLRHGEVSADNKSNLKKELLFFSNVDEIDLSLIRWHALRFSRNSQNYRMLISICQLIAEGLLLTTNDGDFHLANFFDEKNMHSLYEKFILEYYIKEYPALNADASQISWALDDGIGTMLPLMRSDITLTIGNKTLIIDAKCYTNTTQTYHDTHKLHSNNLYQIFTYVKNKAASIQDENHSVSGMLLYARTESEIQPNNSYKMSGNDIHVKTLNLNCEFREIARELNKIADDFLGEQ